MSVDNAAEREKADEDSARAQLLERLRRQLTRGMIDQSEFETSAYCQLVIRLGECDRSNFRLQIDVCNRSNEEVHCSFSASGIYGSPLRFEIIDSAGRRVFPTKTVHILWAPDSSLGPVIRPGESRTSDLHLEIDHDGVMRCRMWWLRTQPGEAYTIRVRYANLLSNAVVWVAPAREPESPAV